MSPKSNTTAIVALVAAVLGFTCLWGVGGLLAVVLGIVALREIERSEGRETGKGLSIAAITLGGLNVGGLIIALGVGIAFLARPEPPAPIAAHPPSVHPLPRRAPPTTEAPETGARPAPPQGPSETSFGNVRLVDVSATELLAKQLAAQRQEARTSGEKLVVFVVSPECAPCRDVFLALEDERMQRALERVRLVRVDASLRSQELHELGVPLEAVPGFALLDPTLRPADYVHGGEWDADVPENIAPVLGAFVRGKYLRRRHPFQPAQRPDEITL